MDRFVENPERQREQLYGVSATIEEFNHKIEFSEAKISNLEKENKELKDKIDIMNNDIHLFSNRKKNESNSLENGVKTCSPSKEKGLKKLKSGLTYSKKLANAKANSLKNKYKNIIHDQHKQIKGLETSISEFKSEYLGLCVGMHNRK